MTERMIQSVIQHNLTDLQEGEFDRLEKFMRKRFPGLRARYGNGGGEKIVFVGHTFVLKCIWQVRCRREPHIYEAAKAAGVEKFFARTYMPFTCGQWYFYFQENIMKDRKIKSHIGSVKMPNWYNNHNCTKKGGNTIWRDGQLVRYLVKDYPKEAEILHWILYRKNVNDLHGDNWCMGADGVPKIFDFGGWRSEEVACRHEAAHQEKKKEKRKNKKMAKAG